LGPRFSVRRRGLTKALPEEASMEVRGDHPLRFAGSGFDLCADDGAIALAGRYLVVDQGTRSCRTRAGGNGRSGLTGLSPGTRVGRPPPERRWRGSRSPGRAGGALLRERHRVPRPASGSATAPPIREEHRRFQRRLPRAYARSGDGHPGRHRIGRRCWAGRGDSHNQKRPTF
jgi:hypothetical protein